MKHLKFILITILIVLITSLASCKSNNTLTLDKVIELSNKGNDLTWSDFKDYESRDVGHGLYVLLYDIDKKYQLMIGGNNTESKPLYIILTYIDTNDYIDIRTEDVGEFLENNNS